MKAYEFLFFNEKGEAIHSIVLMRADNDAASKAAEHMLNDQDALVKAHKIRHYEVQLEVTFTYMGKHMRIPVKTSTEAKIISSVLQTELCKEVKLIVMAPAEGCEVVLLVRHGEYLVSPAMRYKLVLMGL